MKDKRLEPIIHHVLLAGISGGGLTGNKTTTVCNGQLQGRSSSPLIVSGGIVGVPNQDTWDRGVHAQGHQTRHGEPSVGCLHVCDNGIADYRNRQDGKYDETANF
jgi:hypothetical protein